MRDEGWEMSNGRWVMRDERWEMGDGRARCPQRAAAALKQQ